MPSPFWTLLFPLLTLTTARTFKVQYYTDGGCKTYATEIYPPVGGGCYNYQWTGSNSANIAFSDFPNGASACTFYADNDCKGPSQNVVYNTGNNCASNFGRGFYSMNCGIDHHL